jgi:hypothetical protein
MAGMGRVEPSGQFVNVVGGNVALTLSGLAGESRGSGLDRDLLGSHVLLESWT